MKRMLVLLALILIGMGALISSACGLFTAPFSVPAAIADNHNMHLKGRVVDLAGQPVIAVTMNVQKSHTWWDPTLGSRVEHEDSSTAIDGQFDVARRGSTRVTLSFDKPGYRKVYLQFDETHLWVEKRSATRSATEPATAPATSPALRSSWGGHRGESLPDLVLDPTWKPDQTITVVLPPQ